MAKFNIRADYFRAAAECRSTEEARPYLNGVYVEPHAQGVLMVATNGHFMAVIHDPVGIAARPALLSCDWRNPVLKPARGDAGARRLDIDGKTATVRVSNGETIYDGTQVGLLAIDEVDGTFPDWRRTLPVEPESDKAPCNAYSAVYIETLRKSAVLAGADNKRAACRIWNSANNGPAAVRFSGVDHAFYVLMPYRWNVEGPVKPEWLNAEPRSAVAAE